MLGQPLNRPLFDAAEVGIAVVAMRFQPETVELKIDFDALAVLGKEVEQRIVAGDLDAIRVDQNTDDVPLHDRGQELPQLRMDRRLAPADHQDIDLAVLAQEALINIREYGFDRDDPVEAG